MKNIAIASLLLAITQTSHADNSEYSVLCYDPYTESVHTGSVEMKKNCDQVNRVLRRIDNFTCKFGKPGKAKDCDQNSIVSAPEYREIDDLQKVMFFRNRNWSMK